MAKGKKTGGRSKGTPNKRTADLHDIAREIECDPFKILLLYAKRDWLTLGYDSKERISPELQVKAASEACQYMHAKRKAVEHSFNPAELDDPALIEEAQAAIAHVKEKLKGTS